MELVELELPSTPPAPQDTITCRQLLAFGLLTEEEILDGYQTRYIEAFRWTGLGDGKPKLEHAELPVTPYSQGNATGVGINLRAATLNGILFLKGGDLEEELRPYRKKVRTWDVSDYFEEPYFETKKVVYLPFK